MAGGGGRRHDRGVRLLVAVLAFTAACAAPGRDGGPREVVCDALGSCVPVADEGDDGGDGSSDPQDDWPVEWIAKEDEMLALVNAFRAGGPDCPSGSRPPARALSSNEALRGAARLHSQDMANEGYFSHTSLDGRDPFDRMFDAGYDGQPAGENIAGGQGDAQATFDQWVSSSGHCSNMAASDFDDIGIGYAFVEGSPFGHYWTQTFGSR